MVYYIDNELMIRNMEEADARIFTDEEIKQGWHTDISKFLPGMLISILPLPAVHSAEKDCRRSLILAYWKNTGGGGSAVN